MTDLTPKFHHVGTIPKPPEDYIAHPYTLIPSGKVAGRAKQLDLLTEWATATDHNVRILNVVAIGGMGKSAPCTFKLIIARAFASFDPHQDGLKIDYHPFAERFHMHRYR